MWNGHLAYRLFRFCGLRAERPEPKSSAPEGRRLSGAFLFQDAA